VKGFIRRCFDAEDDDHKIRWMGIKSQSKREKKIPFSPFCSILWAYGFNSWLIACVCACACVFVHACVRVRVCPCVFRIFCCCMHDHLNRASIVFFHDCMRSQEIRFQFRFHKKKLWWGPLVLCTVLRWASRTRFRVGLYLCKLDWWTLNHWVGECLDSGAFL